MSDILKGALKILVIEDDPGDFALVRIQVRLARFGEKEGDLGWARTLAEGIDMARLAPPDVVLLDLMLPDSSGLATVRRMRAAMTEPAIIVLTGQDDPALAGDALEAGAQDYLVKGQYDQDALGRAVRNAIVRRRLERKVALNDQRFQDFSSATSDWWFWEMDAELRFSYFSANALLATGRLPETMLGKRRQDLSEDLTGRDSEKWTSHLADLAQRRPFNQFEYRIALDNGEFRWLSISGVPIFAGDGGFLGYRGTGTNITARKLADDKLHSNERILTAAIDAIDEAFVLYDSDDRLVFCNEKYRSIYALSADLIVPGATFEHIIREGARRGQYPQAIGRVEEWVAERLAAHRRSNRQLIQKLDNGRWLRIVERKTADNHIVGFRVDVTELQLAREMAETANAAKSMFLASMSHEIRTPLNGVLGMAQLLLMPELTEAERHEYARTILNSGQSLLTILNDILDLSKIEAGKLDLAKTAFDPQQALKETTALFAKLAQGKDLKIETVWRGPEGVRYLADPNRVGQMLANLLSNAIKFTRRGSIRVHACEVERGGGEALLEFAVTDSGIGIPQDKQSMLFKPFSQVDDSNTRKYGGTGLGLSIVRRLAILMGGDVGLESEVGKGSTFWFRIRANILCEAQQAHHAEQANAVERPMDNGQARRVLVVEDNSTNRKVIETLLKKLNIKAESAEDGLQAVAAVSAGMNPDLVFMDCQMPVMDGYEATRRIRLWECENARPRLPIIALTAGAFAEDRDRCIESGMDDFLAKPIDISILKATLQRWLASPRSTAMPAERLPTAASPLPDVPGFDVAAALARIDDDVEEYRNFLKMFREGYSEGVSGIGAAMTRGDAHAARMLAHSLKGSAGTIGAVKLQAAAALLEKSLKDSLLDCELFAAVENEWQQTLSSLTILLGPTSQ